MNRKYGPEHFKLLSNDFKILDKLNEFLIEKKIKQAEKQYQINNISLYFETLIEEKLNDIDFFIHRESGYSINKQYNITSMAIKNTEICDLRNDLTTLLSYILTLEKVPAKKERLKAMTYSIIDYLQRASSKICSIRHKNDLFELKELNKELITEKDEYKETEKKLDTYFADFENIIKTQLLKIDSFISDKSGYYDYEIFDEDEIDAVIPEIKSLITIVNILLGYINTIKNNSENKKILLQMANNSISYLKMILNYLNNIVESGVPKAKIVDYSDYSDKELPKEISQGIPLSPRQQSILNNKKRSVRGSRIQNPPPINPSFGNYLRTGGSNKDKKVKKLRTYNFL